MSVVESTRRKRDQGDKDEITQCSPKAALKRKNGIKILKIKSDPIRKGLKIVINL